MIRNIFDFDGVTTIGIHPTVDDIIITGRTVDESRFVLDYVWRHGLQCPVYFNPCTIQTRGRGTVECRKHSALHKAKTIVQLVNGGVQIGKIFEDDKVQIDVMKECFKNTHPWLIDCIIHIFDGAKNEY
jgi:hypothetical protein